MGGYVVTPRGLKIRWRERDGEAVVQWQVRHRVEGMFVLLLGEDGKPLRRVPFASHVFREHWEDAGRVSLDDVAASSWSAPGLVRQTQEGVMRHVLEWAALGYGDSVREVVSWVEPGGPYPVPIREVQVIAQADGMLKGLDGERLLWHGQGEVSLMGERVLLSDGDVFRWTVPVA